MSEKILTIPQIVENLREMPEWFEAHNKYGYLLILDVRNLADRIEQAVTNCNQLKMREALKYLRDASREFHHLILNSKHNEICDKYKYPEVMKIRDAIANAGVVLAEPVRNCDRQYENGYDVLRRFTAETGRQIFDTVDVINWLLAEAKGEGTK